jgi:uncharacterized membrane-anchored protein YjiN (DUF445 family)
MNKKNQKISEKVLNERRRMLKIQSEQANNFINNIILQMFQEYERKLKDDEDERKEM